MRNIILVVCLFTLSINAKPVYLSCSVDRINVNPADKKATVKSNIKLDEDTNKVTFSSDSTAFTTIGFFSSDTIEFSSQVEIGGTLKRSVEINRSTLDMHMGLQIIQPDINFISDPTYFKGQCKVVQKKNKI